MSPLERYRFCRDCPPTLVGGPIGKLILYHLCARSNKHGEVVTSYHRIAQDEGVSRSAVARAVKRLRDIGLISIRRKFKSANHYTLQFEGYLHMIQEMTRVKSIRETQSSVTASNYFESTRETIN